MHVVESDLRARAAIARGKLPRAIVERAAFDFVLSFLGFIAAIVVIRGTDAALAGVRLIENRADLAYHVVGCVDDAPESSHVDNVPVIGRIADLSRLIGQYRVTNVLVAASISRNGLVKRIHSECAKSAGPNGAVPKVRVLPNLNDL